MRPLRRTILQFSQMRLTLERTFMTNPFWLDYFVGSRRIEIAEISTGRVTVRFKSEAAAARSHPSEITARV
jgi:hypothetical protein